MTFEQCAEKIVVSLLGDPIQHRILQVETLLRAARDAELSAAHQEIEELDRKGKELCEWIGPLLTRLNVSTPQDAHDVIDRIETERDQLKSERDALRAALEKIMTIHARDFPSHLSSNEGRNAFMDGRESAAKIARQALGEKVKNG